jgi:hypothetical protein
MYLLNRLSVANVLVRERTLCSKCTIELTFEDFLQGVDGLDLCSL